jgi:hypothetical protein
MSLQLQKIGRSDEGIEKPTISKILHRFVFCQTIFWVQGDKIGRIFANVSGDCLLWAFF